MGTVAPMTTTTEIFRTPDERFADLPGYDFEPNYVEIDGLRMHYLDEGPSDGTPIVCFHGEPSWAYLYRKMVARSPTPATASCAPDYAGFGRSDKPTDRGWYTYDRHVELRRRRCSTGSIEGATVIVQDWGGPIGLRWAVEHDAGSTSLAVLNTGIFTGRVSQGLHGVARVRREEPGHAGRLRAPGRDGDRLPDEVVAAYEAPFPTPESKAGAAQFPLLVPIAEDSPAPPRCAPSPTR